MTETTRHDRIFLQVCDDDGEYERRGDITWCQDRIHDTDVEYIRKELHDQQISERDAQLLKNADLLGEAADALDHMEKQNVDLREALKDKSLYCSEEFCSNQDEFCCRQKQNEALAATADLAGLVVCDAVPYGYLYEAENDNGFILTNELDGAEPNQNWTKLYKARKP